MKKTIITFIFCFSLGACFSQAGEWVWIKGDSTPNQPGNYGVQGVSSPFNEPPSWYEPCEWKDLNGNLWVYILADLWKYDPITNEWTWMKGPGTNSYPGNYGVQGVSSPANNPPALSTGITSWTDSQGNFWMFGGTGSGGPFNALWKFNVSTNEWTWMKGSNIGGQPGVYGTQGVASPSNLPGSRWECVASWTDNNDNLWLFGGFNAALYNDLWRYSIANNEWTWMKGSQTPNQPGVYGIQGVEGPLNTPGCRMSYSRWKDNNGNLWLFGGFLYSTTPYNDLWRYNVLTNNWAWVSGSNTGVSPETYGIKCIPSSSNIPGARYESRTTWTDQNGNFYLFGGGTYAAQNVWNDLWKYCVVTNKWMWVTGNNTVNPSGHWGTQGISSSFNEPDGRFGAIGMSDNNGHLYVFGGCTNGLSNKYNDLWKYTIDTSCGVCPILTGITGADVQNQFDLLPNPSNTSVTISFQSISIQQIEIKILNTLGEEVYFSKEQSTSEKFKKEINVQNLSNGIYFVLLKSGTGLVNKKIIVRH